MHRISGELFAMSRKKTSLHKMRDDDGPAWWQEVAVRYSALDFSHHDRSHSAWSHELGSDRTITSASLESSGTFASTFATLSLDPTVVQIIDKTKWAKL